MSRFKSISDEDFDGVLTDLTNLYKAFSELKEGDDKNIKVKVKDSIVYLGDDEKATISIYDIKNNYHKLMKLKLEI